jgi:hypothetical protein
MVFWRWPGEYGLSALTRCLPIGGTLFSNVETRKNMPRPGWLAIERFADSANLNLATAFRWPEGSDP